MGIYEFTCEACHNKIRVKKEAGQELDSLLCDACAQDKARIDTLSDEALEAEVSEALVGKKARTR